MPDVADELDAEYCPVSIGASLIGERWSLLIVRELMTGASRFNDIQRGLPGLSRSTLTERLRYLERLGVIAARRDPRGYALTIEGEALRPVILAIGEWTVKHHFPTPTERQSDPSMIIWRVSQGLNRDALPEGRFTIEFRFPGSPKPRAWIVLRGREPTVCLEHPGYDIDLVVTATARVWNEVWYGHRALPAAVREGEIELLGAPAATRAFSAWFTLSPFASSVAYAR
ncbi:helix-turn-helix domain-containing protein [Microbacterium sp. SORGH_AS_0888]|uniref:winged helix-turn-helix transcriptional regulator n=1 Tax=Microbacterium sp. SORGH_AS_0888 TaxID=3041791 RepID=UPI00278412A1|nr:helix-turn-helix domain-containing protein [Microbacterium sp. SORGH_AS_0888]MDQ1128361.1 DNA-binding HxlR family transcriptional regulator [Microbacterium sp. SORGH_AS_0888]